MNGVDGMGLIEREVTEAEWHQIESQRAAQVIVGGDPLTPYDLIGVAEEVVSLRQQLGGAVDALERIAHHEREGDYAGQVNAMRAIASDALPAAGGQ